MSAGFGFNQGQGGQDEQRPIENDYETDPRFPSGRWQGFYKQGVKPGDMELDLAFAAGVITGGGRDPVGVFTIAGSYDTSIGRCEFSKRYASHTVEYRGYRESQGIFGQWQISGQFARDRGGFLIWPIDGQGHGNQAETHADAPVESAQEVLVGVSTEH